MGAKYLDANTGALRPDGRLVVIGLQGGRKATIDLGALLAKRGTVLATSLRGRPTAQKAEICRIVAERVWPLFASGRIVPAPETRMPLTDVVEAHRKLESGSNIGKIVLVP
jgi:NADPH:quinone reductase-like Zn-dependent oxidoreductase